MNIEDAHQHLDGNSPFIMYVSSRIGYGRVKAFFI